MIIYTITIQDIGGVVQVAMSPDNRHPNKHELVAGSIIDIAVKTAGEIMMFRQKGGTMVEGEGVEQYVARLVKEQIAKSIV